MRFIDRHPHKRCIDELEAKMAKEDYTCDVCGEYAPAHDPECVFGRNGRQRAVAEAMKRKADASPKLPATK